MNLRFECTMCGACCRRPGVVVLGADELVTIAQHLRTSPDELVELHSLEARDDGSWWLPLRTRVCPFLIDERCSIQAVKPRQCAAYPFWPELVSDIDAWDAEAEQCPGIGRGPTWADADVVDLLDLLAQ